MSATPIIKAGRVAHLTDARYFAAMEVDFLGFNLEEGTPGYLDPIFMKAIREWVQGPRIVGEFSHTPIETVRDAAIFFGLETVQVSAKKHGAALDKLDGLEIMVAIEIGPGGLEQSLPDVEKMASQAHFFLFQYLGESAPASFFYAEKNFWREVFALRPSLLQADIPVGELAAFLTDFGLAGIALFGGEEEELGVKSFDAVDEIFEVLR